MGDTADPKPLAAEIVTTGTEILLGEIVDTNAAWIAQQLRDTGVNLYYKTTVGDNEARLRSILTLGLGRSDVILVSGGLGPTKDDITRQAIAASTGCPLQVHEGVVATLKARFERFGSQMTENNLQQAMIPAGATVIENPVGTAPGFIVETEQGVIIAIPGVPREMKQLMTDTVIPYLRRRSGYTGLIRRRILRTVGIGESSIDDRLQEYMDWSNPTVGLAAKTAQCDVRITARADSVEQADAMLDDLETAIRARIGEHIYSTTPDEPFETVVRQQLADRGMSLALLETNTGGRVAQRLGATEQGGAGFTHHYVLGTDDLPDSVVAVLASATVQAAGSGEAGAQETGHLADLPVYDEGAARDAATALRRATGDDLGLVLLGTHGKDQGVFGKETAHTWLALAHDGGVETMLSRFGGEDEVTAARLGNHALAMVWRRLKS